ncbi:MAG: flagellar basal body-associated FliL family protein [Deltaproteobacteria bacterium]|nr:flagellar basal body-associated FliL family protein [Deltaproteobacteria bacterium]
MLIVVVGVVLFLTGVVGGSAAPVDDKAQLELDLPNKPRPTVALKEFVVNLADQEPRYLKATVQLEVANEKVAAACEANMAAIRNSLVELLSSKAYLQIRDVRGKTKLREEVIVRLNEILGANGITQVYFTDFIVQ